MNKISKYNQHRFIIGLISLFSLSFLTSAPFESNPQDCEVISVIPPKKGEAYLSDDDHMPMPV